MGGSGHHIANTGTLPKSRLCLGVVSPEWWSIVSLETPHVPKLKSGLVLVERGLGLCICSSRGLGQISAAIVQIIP